MQRGIDQFFKKLTAAKKSDDDESPAPVKRKARVIESSDEDEAPAQSSRKGGEQRDKKLRSSEAASPKSLQKKPMLSKLKKSPKKELTPVDPMSLFGGTILRKDAEPRSKLASNIVNKTTDIDAAASDTSPIQSISEDATTPRTDKKSHGKDVTSPRKWNSNTKSSGSSSEKHETPPLAKKPKLNDSAAKESSKKGKSTAINKGEQSDLDRSVLTDEERFERKRMSAVLYQKYKNRQSVLNPGSKEVPKGAENCLAGCTFLVTGVLESLERDEIASIIKGYGGRMMTVVGKRLNYLIAGEESGPKKLAMAEEFNIPVLSEDGFFDLIRTKSAKDDGQHEPEKPSTSVKASAMKKIADGPQLKALNGDDRKFAQSKETESEAARINVAVVKKELQGASNIPEDMIAWVDKYKPTTMQDIIGQQGSSSNAAKLFNWLSKWYTNRANKTAQRPNPWAKNDDGSSFRAALLSGPPGVGKTTTVQLVCKELGFDTVEFNASDTRSKRQLKGEVSESLSNKSLFGYCHGNKEQPMSKRHVLIMDEVDGMAGSEDRNGIQELIAMIKSTAVPVICICNDRNHQKIRSLVTYCYDLRFMKPQLKQIKALILSICHKEKLKLNPMKIEEIIAATNNDIRQSINHISLMSASKDLADGSSSGNGSGVIIEEKVAEKDLKMGPWEVVRKVFSADDHKHMSIHDKSDLFFHDYSLAPLFVQQNYLQVSPAGPKGDILRKVAMAADALSLGDLADKRIRSNSSWSLLPTMALFSSVMPGTFMSGYFTGQINFPAWLGKNSRASRRSRLAQEVQDHTRAQTSSSRQSVRLDYAPFLLAAIVRPLKADGLDGIEATLNVLKAYHLLREDIDSLVELTTWPGMKSLMDAVDGRVKAALTRAYNKEGGMVYSYSSSAGVEKKKAVGGGAAVDEADNALYDVEDGEQDVISSDEKDEDDDVGKDKFIKVGKGGKAVKATATATATKGAGGKRANKAAKAGATKK